ncbi:MAG: Hsp33 family molecular chaperone HslO [Gammaproteobacteria bacterium]|nr:Hsp33 family molecular chaperone HslO [Gammaproteobacteria bacterium]MBU1491961.1 Hsp33 family molecular chaperone HslO [Gammaproteobacteria bacterium]MBU2065774.1 Hsp33 family molecular chaperone HslO [Gammaproteobacteria bacterium]MBU2140563.1 Hsp33 family molecular chaperone HslO [Gammaproteobacteria bacterium]MBU2215856.1 Hsp33 family molecular chaperone HslO [Gammaproteobacteria bacterium]
MTDFTQRFLFDDTDVRGELVSLEASYQHVLAKHAYPQPVAQLLGELLAAASLLVGTLKFEGLLILQARSEGAVPLLMVECSSEGDVRGIARYHAEQIGADAGLAELMPEGVLAMTIDPTQGQRYQGIVALDGFNLAECFTNYFVTSEQLSTRFWLSADGQRARGLLLQQLPADRLKDPEEREASWQHVATLADTLQTEELLGLDNETLLYRLYHEEPLRLFEPRGLQFRCSCSRERSANALVSLGQADAELLIEENAGSIVIDCQFCNERYAFDAADVAQLFAGGGSQAPSGTRH